MPGQRVCSIIIIFQRGKPVFYAEKILKGIVLNRKINVTVNISGWNYTDLIGQRVDAAHKHNMAVHDRTLNNAEKLIHLIEIGADGIMSDYPRRLKEAYDNRGN